MTKFSKCWKHENRSADMANYKRLTSVSPLSGSYCSSGVREPLLKNMSSSIYKSKYFLITILSYLLYKCFPCNRLWRPTGLWGIEAPIFSRQSVHRWWWGCQPYLLATLYPPGRFLVLISVRSCRPQGHSVAGSTMSIEKSNYLIVNQTCNLPACSVVPQPTTLLCAPSYLLHSPVYANALLRGIYWDISTESFLGIWSHHGDDNKRVLWCIKHRVKSLWHLKTYTHNRTLKLCNKTAI
jgi:hypothetical protein